MCQLFDKYYKHLLYCLKNASHACTCVHGKGCSLHYLSRFLRLGSGISTSPWSQVQAQISDLAERIFASLLSQGISEKAITWDDIFCFLFCLRTGYTTAQDALHADKLLGLCVSLVTNNEHSTRCQCLFKVPYAFLFI